MKRPWLWFVITANLAVIVALVFVYPHLMISPGALVPEHAALATDCFACHAPLRSASPERCIACHALADIGLRSTRGVPIPAAPSASAAGARRPKAAFHQSLAEQNCMACHTDHAGPKLARGSRKPFSHALLREETRARCETCHTPPADTLHQKIAGDCGQCHTSQAWTPATFEHDKFFLLDEDHNAPCATCHSAGNFKSYTCYGCHEHTPARVQAQHREEVGGQNLDHCVRCHRNASGESEGHGGREGGERD